MDKTEKRRIEIIQKTILAVHEKGFNGTGVKEITQLAGIPKGSFYNYFKSKEDYFIKAITYQLNRILDASLNTLQNKQIDPDKRILMFYKNSINDYKNIGFKLGCFIGNLSEEMGDLNPQIATLTEQAHARISNIVLTNLNEIKIPSVYRNVDNMILANFIVNSWQGALLRMKSAKQIEPLANFYEMLETILDIKGN